MFKFISYTFLLGTIDLDAMDLDEANFTVTVNFTDGESSTCGIVFNETFNIQIKSVNDHTPQFFSNATTTISFNENNEVPFTMSMVCLFSQSHCYIIVPIDEFLLIHRNLVIIISLLENYLLEYDLILLNLIG